MDHNPHLKLRLMGGMADRHRLSLTDLSVVTAGIQAAVRNVGAVLVGQRTGHGGRKLGWIEDATELVLVATPSRGSVELDLEFNEPSTLAVEDSRDLGPRALAALIAGIDSLDEDPASLPEGFDPGVLKALATLASVFNKGLEGLELCADGERPGSTVVTAKRVATVRRIMSSRFRAPVVLEGVLKAVDLADDPLSCRIDRPFAQGVPCLIPVELKPTVLALMDHQVHVEGEGDFEPGRDDPLRVRVHVLVEAEPEMRFDRLAWRQHRPWQELALQRGAGPFAVDELEPLFDDEEDLDRFIAAAKGYSSANE